MPALGSGIQICKRQLKTENDCLFPIQSSFISGYCCISCCKPRFAILLSLLKVVLSGTRFLRHSHTNKPTKAFSLSKNLRPIARDVLDQQSVHNSFIIALSWGSYAGKCRRNTKKAEETLV